MTAVLASALTVDAKAFAGAVSWAAKAVPSHPTNPVLGGILLEVSDGKLRASGFDYDTAATASVDVEGVAEGRWLVSGRLLDYLAKTFAGDVTLEPGEKLALKCGCARFGLPTMPAGDYPTLPALPVALGVVDGQALAESVHRVAVAVDPNNATAMLTGLSIRLRDGQMIVAGSDGYRAGIDHIAWARTGGGDIDLLVPAAALANVGPMLDGEVTIASDGNLLGLSSPTRSVVTRLMDNAATPYPDVDRRFPNVGETPVRMEASRLAAAVKRAELMLPPKESVLLALDRGSLIVRSSGNGDGDEPVACTYNGAAVEVRVNPNYFVTALSAVGAAEVALHVTANGNAVVVVDAASEAPTYRHMVRTIDLSRITAA